MKVGKHPWLSLSEHPMNPDRQAPFMPGCRGAQCIQAPILVLSGLVLCRVWTVGFRAAQRGYAAMWPCGYVWRCVWSWSFNYSNREPKKKKGFAMERFGRVRLCLEASVQEEREERSVRSEIWRFKMNFSSRVLGLRTAEAYKSGSCWVCSVLNLKSHAFRPSPPTSSYPTL